MKRLFAVLAVAVCIATTPALAVEKYLGTITATTTSKTQSSTAVPFTIGDSNHLLVQCDAAAHYAWVTSSSGTVSTSNGVKVDAGVAWPTKSGDSYRYLAVVAVSGTVNCRVFLVQ